MAVAALALTAPAGAEVIPMTGQFPAKYVDASLLRRLVVTPFDGGGGAQLASAIEAELAAALPGETAYFTIVPGGTGKRRVGGEGILSGRVVTNVAQEPFQSQRSQCVEGAGFFKCKRSVMVTQACTRRVITMTVEARILRTSDRQVVYSSTKPYQDDTSWCEGGLPGASAEGVAAAMSRAAAQAIKKDIAPYEEAYQVRLEESTDGLTKPAAKAFRAAVKISTRDLATSCQQWQQLRTGGETSLALLFAVGVCAEKAGDLVTAASNYSAAQALAPAGNKNVAEASNRVRLLTAARDAAASQRNHRDSAESGERRAVAAEERAVVAAKRAEAAKATQAKAAIVAVRKKDRQDIAKTYGEDAADAIVAKTVKKGMTPAQVRAALGEPQRIQRIGVGEEQWIYPGKRLVFLNGRVSYVG